MEIAKPLDSRTDDAFPSTSPLPHGDIKAIYEMKNVATSIKSWEKDQLGKVKTFLQNTMEIVEETNFNENALI